MSFCAAAVGTETSGSIISPSSANGIAGLKPTVGVVSRSGIVPINSQDTAGPMGRPVEDVAVLLNALKGEDEDDPATLCTEAVVAKDYTAFLNRDALKGARLGVLMPGAAMAGYPILTVPAGVAADGRPIGLSFIGSAFEDGKLIGYGYAFEQMSHLRVVPEGK